MADTAPRPGRRAQAARRRKCCGLAARAPRGLCHFSQKACYVSSLKTAEELSHALRQTSKNQESRREPDEVQLVDLALFT